MMVGIPLHNLFHMNSTASLSKTCWPGLLAWPAGMACYVCMGGLLAPMSAAAVCLLHAISQARLYSVLALI